MIIHGEYMFHDKSKDYNVGFYAGFWSDPLYANPEGFEDYQNGSNEYKEGFNDGQRDRVHYKIVSE